MRGTMKGNAYSNGRKRPYALMLLLAFGAAVFGVLVIHKLREKRIYNIILNHKDRQIISLQLSLQNEKEQAQEAKRKIEEMKVTMSNLQNQKILLKSNVLELQSTISSLKDEHKILELALQEKQNEAKLLRERYAQDEDTNSQVHAQSEILRQKDTENSSVWFMSTDDPSNSSAKLTTEKDILRTQSRGEDTNMYDPEITNRISVQDGSAITREEQSESMDKTQESKSESGKTESDERHDRVEQKNAIVLRNGETFNLEEKKNRDEPEMDTRPDGKEKPKDEDGEVHHGDGKDVGATENSQSQRTSDSQGGDSEELVNHKGGVKLEMQESHYRRKYRLRRQGGPQKMKRGKRWRTSGKHTVREGKNEQISSEGMVEIIKNLEAGKPEEIKENHDVSLKTGVNNDSTSENQKSDVSDKLQEADIQVSHSGSALEQEQVKENSYSFGTEDSKVDGDNSQPGSKSLDRKNSVGPGETYQQLEKGPQVNLTDSTSANSYISLDEETAHTTINDEETKTQQSDDEQSKEETNVQKHIQAGEDGQGDNSSQGNEADDKNEDPDDAENEEVQASESNLTTTTTTTTTESTSNLEEENEDDKEESEEPEF